jgi:hypothetical protein
MSLINLICPHCGGNFELDHDRALQPLLTCPYCGNRSLMQKNEGSIRLRGIITSKTHATVPATPVQLPVSLFLDKAETPDQTASQPETVTPAAVTVPAAAAVPPPAAVVPPAVTPHPTAATTAKTAPPAAAPPLTAVPAAKIAPPAAATLPTRSLEEIIAETQANPPPPVAKEEPVRNHTGSVPVRPLDLSQRIQTAADSAEADRFCELAEAAAKRHDLPIFNAYSRQAIDRRPEDPRMYALRAILTEEADGFARSTWTNPTWVLLTPMRKQALVTQHLYNLNTALKYSRPERYPELLQQTAWQLVRQATDFFTEQADLRCRQNLIFKKFKGRFRRSDLRSARLLLEALRLINQETCSLGWQDLLDFIRRESRQAPKRIARKLKKL